MARAIGAAAVCFTLAACYTLQAIPGRTMPGLGARIAVDINDAGRAAMGGQIGSEIAQIEGRLTSSEGSDYELAVSTVRLMRGGEQVWKGERVRVKQEHVTMVYEKQFSRGRTIAASAVGIGLVAYFATKAIIGSALGDEGVVPPDTADMVRRPIRP